MRSIFLVLVSMLLVSPTFGDDIPMSRADRLLLVVGSYVNGFKEFDTSVQCTDSQVSVGIYYDVPTQSADRANQLAERFRVQVPFKLKAYGWADGVKIVVTVYSEDRTNGGY